LYLFRLIEFEFQIYYYFIYLFIYLFFQIDATKKTLVVSRSYEVPLFTFMLIHWSFWKNFEQNSKYSSMCHPILCTIVCKTTI